MRKTIQEYLGIKVTAEEPWPVIERGPFFPTTLTISVKEKHRSSAVKKDPCHCAIARAVQDAWNLPRGITPAIGGRWAYIPMQVMHRGRVVKFIARMQATADTQRAIAEFDKTEKFPEAGFIFKPIAEGHTFAQKRAYNQLRGKANRDNAKRSGRKRSHTKRNVGKRIFPRGLVIGASRFSD